jgi:hypothetical protein
MVLQNVGNVILHYTTWHHKPEDLTFRLTDQLNTKTEPFLTSFCHILKQNVSVKFLH